MKNNLINFPAEVRDDIASISDNGGVLSAERCKRVCQKLSINIESLMVRLVPLAASYSNPSISSFQVGAVASGVEKEGDGSSNLYLGANFEFENQALCYSVHAEQSAVSNAWLHDEPGITAIAVSAPPCGHCRQFLYEVAGTKPFPILLPSASVNSTLVDVSDLKTTDGSMASDFVSVDLSQLLPAAFGPLDLGCERLLMEQDFGSNHLKLTNINDDDLVSKALQAANLSYAPYTLNFAGCALKLTCGKIYTGRYAENAAYNPSLNPFSAALSKMVLSIPPFGLENIERVVLVECPTKISQRDVTQSLLAACSKVVKLEYHTAFTELQ